MSGFEQGKVNKRGAAGVPSFHRFPAAREIPKMRTPGAESPGASALFLAAIVVLVILAVPRLGSAQEPPYFVTYSDYMEEPGNLEFAYKGAVGTPKYSNRFDSGTLEFEYGATGWWTTEVYLQAAHQANQYTMFTGFRWENRFRPLPREHFINPVFYFEFEDVNAGDRSLLEITGHDSISELTLTNDQGKLVTEKSLETKLILSSQTHGWDISENFIAERDLDFDEPEPWEFGYAVGVSRPLALSAKPKPCVFCRQNFSAGLELYGGLGTSDGFGLQATSHYIAPTLGFHVPRGPTINFSPNFGLNDNSLGVLYRFAVSYEFDQLFRGWRIP